jgi:hypothetical protein
LKIGHRLGHAVFIANATALMGWHLAWTGRVNDGLAHLDAAYEAAVELNQPITAWLAGWATSALAWVGRDAAAAPVRVRPCGEPTQGGARRTSQDQSGQFERGPVATTRQSLLGK